MDLRLLLWTLFTGVAFISSTAHGSIGYGSSSLYGYGGYPPLHGYGRHGINSYGRHGYGGYGHGFSGYGHGFGGYGHGFGGYGDDHYGYGGYDDDHDSDDDCIEASPQAGVDVVCAQQKDVGSGSEQVTKYFFNYPEGECEKFTYRGSGGNDNLFDTLEGCNTFCLGVSNPCGSKKKSHKKHKNYGVHDHLYATKHRIDSYLAKSYLLGKKRLNVEVKYLNTPLEYQYLNQYHGLKHPLTHTPFAGLFGIRNPPHGHYQGYQSHYMPVTSNPRYQSYGTPQVGYGSQGYSQQTPQHGAYGTTQVGYANQGYSQQTSQHGSYETPQVGYANQGYSQQTPQYGSAKPYQQDVYASTTVPKQPVYGKRTTVTQTYQNSNGYPQAVSVSGQQSNHGHIHTTHSHAPADQGGLAGHHPAEAAKQ